MKEKPGISTVQVQPNPKETPQAERFCPSSSITFMGTMSEGYEDVSSLFALSKWVMLYGVSSHQDTFPSFHLSMANVGVVSLSPDLCLWRYNKQCA